MSRIFKSVHLNPNEKKLIELTKNQTEQRKQNKDNISQEPSEENQELLAEAKIKAENIIKSAEDEAYQIKQTAKNEIENWWQKQRSEDTLLKENAQQEGYDYGYQSGYGQIESELKAEYASLFEQVKSILKEAHMIKQQMIQEAEPELIELSIMIAEKIIVRELEMDSEIIKGIVKQALKKTREYEKITIDVHPDHFSYLQSAREELMLELNGQVELLIFPDPSIHTGGCVIRTSTGTIDAKIDTQLDELKSLLLDYGSRVDG